MSYYHLFLPLYNPIQTSNKFKHTLKAYYKLLKMFESCDKKWKQNIAGKKKNNK